MICYILRDRRDEKLALRSQFSLLITFHLSSCLHETDFEILAFPCNQFAGQEPGSNEEIVQFACTRFKAEYPIFDKVSYNFFLVCSLLIFHKSNLMDQCLSCFLIIIHQFLCCCCLGEKIMIKFLAIEIVEILHRY